MFFSADDVFIVSTVVVWFVVVSIIVVSVVVFTGNLGPSFFRVVLMVPRFQGGIDGRTDIFLVVVGGSLLRAGSGQVA